MVLPYPRKSVSRFWSALSVHRDRRTCRAAAPMTCRHKRRDPVGRSTAWPRPGTGESSKCWSRTRRTLHGKPESPGSPSPAIEKAERSFSRKHAKILARPAVWTSSSSLKVESCRAYLRMTLDSGSRSFEWERSQSGDLPRPHPSAVHSGCLQCYTSEILTYTLVKPDIRHHPVRCRMGTCGQGGMTDYRFGVGRRMVRIKVDVTLRPTGSESHTPRDDSA